MAEVIPHPKFTELPKRPGYGTNGRRLKVYANFFEITNFLDCNIYHYDISIQPDVPRSIKRKIFTSLVAQNAPIKNANPAYDGQKSFYCSRPLDLGGPSKVIQVRLEEDDGAPSGKRPPRIFKVSLQKAAEINTEELHRFVDGKSAMSGNVQSAIQALDVVFRHSPAMAYPIVGRSFFMRDGAVSLGGGIEMWRGFFQSVRPSKGKLLLNVDLSATAFYEPVDLIEYVSSVLNLRSPNDLSRGLQQRDVIKVEKALKNVKIVTTHRGGESKRMYRISKVTSDTADRRTFEDKDGKKVTIGQYFRQTYNRSLRFGNLPCVLVGDVKKGIALPMEVCKIVSGQRYMKKLGDKQTANMIRQTASKPFQRRETNLKGVEQMDLSRNSLLQGFDVKVKTSMVQLEGRQLPSPRLLYGQQSKGGASVVVRDGGWNLKDKVFYSPSSSKNWVVIPFIDQRDVRGPQDLYRFIDALVRECKFKGMRIANEKPTLERPVGAHCNAGQVITGIVENHKRQHGAPPDMIVCILPFRAPIYHDIKKICELSLGIPSQVVLLNHVFKAQAQYCSNVAMKINVKLGGMNVALPKEAIPFVARKPTMIFGADVTHPGIGERNAPSIAAVVGSMNPQATVYAPAIRVQSSRTEIIADLENVAFELLRRFYGATKVQPQQILFYRDGVSEGQFKAVREGEIDAIKRACYRLHPTYKPTITFVVVQKRHHTRFFAVDRQDTDRSGNVQSGLVVDTGVCHPTEFDFYLQSHAGLIGTCRPAHYHVIHDENGISADEMHSLTFNLCHLFQRATRVVSYCPPAYYAHLVAARAKSYVAGIGSDQSQSQSQSASTGATIYEQPRLHPNLDKGMFFM